MFAIDIAGTAAASAIAASLAAPGAAQVAAQVRKLRAAADQFEGILSGIVRTAFQNDPFGRPETLASTGVGQGPSVPPVPTSLTFSAGLGNTPRKAPGRESVVPEARRGKNNRGKIKVSIPA